MEWKIDQKTYTKMHTYTDILTNHSQPPFPSLFSSSQLSLLHTKTMKITTKLKLPLLTFLTITLHYYTTNLVLASTSNLTTWVGSKYEIQCTMCAACDNPCNTPTPTTYPPPPPPPTPSPPPPSPTPTPSPPTPSSTTANCPPPPNSGGNNNNNNNNNNYYSPPPPAQPNYGNSPPQSTGGYYPPPDGNFVRPPPPNPIVPYFPFYYHSPPPPSSAIHLSTNSILNLYFSIILLFILVN